jgi:hypothetical protein
MNLETSLALVPASKQPFLTFVTMPARCQRNHDASLHKNGGDSRCCIFFSLTPVDGDTVLLFTLSSV